MILTDCRIWRPGFKNPWKEVKPDYPGLEKLIEDMWETMYESSGVGLAAPQINKPIRLFVIDSTQIFKTWKKMNRANIRTVPD